MPIPKLLREKYYSSAQAADCLGVHVDTIRKWRKMGELVTTPVKYGKSTYYMFERSYIDEKARTIHESERG